MNNKDLPVYPNIESINHGNAELEIRSATPGLTKREYFAAMAMQGYLASFGVLPGVSPIIESVAEYSVKQADALLRELEKQ